MMLGSHVGANIRHPHRCPFLLAGLAVLVTPLLLLLLLLLHQKVVVVMGREQERVAVDQEYQLFLQQPSTQHATVYPSNPLQS